MSRIVRTAEPDVFFHEDAGYLSPPKQSNLAPLLLIARCGTLGLRANGTLVRLHRPEEWSAGMSGMYGEWSEVDTKCRSLTWDEDRTKTLLEQTESMLLLPEKSLSLETLAIACLVWAQAHIVSLMPYKKAQLRIEELQEAIEDVKKKNSKLKAALTKSKNS
jgi:hypothetical protein